MQPCQIQQLARRVAKVQVRLMTAVSEMLAAAWTTISFEAKFMTIRKMSTHFGNFFSGKRAIATLKSVPLELWEYTCLRHFSSMSKRRMSASDSVRAAQNVLPSAYWRQRHASGEFTLSFWNFWFDELQVTYSNMFYRQGLVQIFLNIHVRNRLINLFKCPFVQMSKTNRSDLVNLEAMSSRNRLAYVTQYIMNVLFESSTLLFKVQDDHTPRSESRTVEQWTPSQQSLLEKSEYSCKVRKCSLPNEDETDSQLSNNNTPLDQQRSASWNSFQSAKSQSNM